MNFDKIVKNIWWSISAFYTMDNLPDSLIITDEDGNIVHYNKKAKEIFGFYNSSKTYHVSSIIKDSKNVIETSLKDLKPVLATATLPEKTFYIEVNVQQKFNGYYLAIRDLTTLTKTIFNEDKTSKFNSEKNVMLTKLEDDIKAPLTSIIGFSQGLLDNIAGQLSEKQEKYVRIINNNASESMELLDKLLAFSKVESSIYEHNFHKFDVVEIFKTIAKDYAQEIIIKHVNFDINYSNYTKRSIYNDSNAIREIFKNIIDIAISMTEKGYIDVTLSTPSEEIAKNFCLRNPENYIHIEIKDTGVGIPDDEMKYLCEPYAQLEKGKKNFLRALKLGIASILIKRLNGVITIHSEVMKGTQYNVLLPIEKEFYE